MQFITLCIIAIVIVILGYVSFQGLDLRKPANWLFGVFGLFCGYILSLHIGINHIDGILYGALTAFMILFQGGTQHLHQQKGRTLARSLLSKYRENDSSSMFAKVVRNILRKFE